jgi:hypothetical protein
MNTSLNFQQDKNRSAKSARRFRFKLLVGLASVCLGVGLLLPVIKNGSWHHHRVPAGQFRADIRTMVAAVRYLLAPEPVVGRSPSIFTGRTATFTQRVPGRTFEMSDSSCNQTATHAGSSTDLPVQT